MSLSDEHILTVAMFLVGYVFLTVIGFRFMSFFLILAGVIAVIFAGVLFDMVNPVLATSAIALASTWVAIGIGTILMGIYRLISEVKEAT